MAIRIELSRLLACVALIVLVSWPVCAPGQVSGAAEGRELLLSRRFLPRDFDRATFEEIWKDWPEPLRAQAAAAQPRDRQILIFRRYGFTPHPDDPTRPLQYVLGDDGWFAMSCFACHGGQIGGQAIEGLPNSNIALATLYDDLRKTKIRLQKPLSNMDVGSMAVPMGTSNGTSNAVVFGIALMAFREPDLTVKPFRVPRLLTHHDMDAPAWWNVRRRSRLYIDGFVEKNARALVPFVMDQRNSGATMRGWEDEFQRIFQYIESLQPPKYPREIDLSLAAKGKTVFDQHCARCHGTYGENSVYPGKIIPIEDVGTDSVRLTALTPADRQRYHESWFAHFGQDQTVMEPRGYQAPPLDGIWATAPYFHNGSVPTLYDVLHPDSRPRIWHRSYDGVDWDKVGLQVESYAHMPAVEREDLRRTYFDATRFGKSNAGHRYPELLNEIERRWVLEYLKTL